MHYSIITKTNSNKSVWVTFNYIMREVYYAKAKSKRTGPSSKVNYR